MVREHHVRCLRVGWCRRISLELAPDVEYHHMRSGIDSTVAGVRLHREGSVLLAAIRPSMYPKPILRRIFVRHPGHRPLHAFLSTHMDRCQAKGRQDTGPAIRALLER